MTGNQARLTALTDAEARDRIATDTAETLFVDAGAGSGKTKSLVDRVRTPDMYAEYVDRCSRRQFKLGDMFVWEAPEFVVYNLATQKRPGSDARLEAVDSTVRAALADAAERGLATLGVPHIGAGIGGLSWPVVSEVFRSAAEESEVDLVAVSQPRHP